MSITKRAETASSTSSPRPHRRLNLTRPTLPASGPVESETADKQSPPKQSPETPEPQVEPSSVHTSKSKSTPAAEATVRVMAYLSPTEADTLEELWIEQRRYPHKPSKSDILRAALVLASDKRDELTDLLSQYRDSTLSRQRKSKAP